MELDAPKKLSATMLKLMKKYNCSTPEEYRAIRKERKKAVKAAVKPKEKAPAPAPVSNQKQKKKK